MTIDVEDYYQVSAFEDVIDRKNWNTLESRVQMNTEKILALLSQEGAKATFFVLASVAKRFPDIVRSIVNQGHELASHGTDHRRASHQTRDEFKKDVGDARRILEDISGTNVLGYRAPSFSFTPENKWVYDVLAEEGYRYSSSVYPVNHDHYGIPDAPRFRYKASSEIEEFPLSTLPLLGKNVPISGGGYFRLYPYILTKQAISRLNSSEERPYIFYLHPWEVDPDQPRISGISAKSKFRHYLNLHRVESRLTRMLRDFHWDTMQAVYGLTD